MAITVLKLGGELLDDAAAVGAAAAAIVRLASSAQVMVVHGGGRAVDAELRARGNTPAAATPHHSATTGTNGTHAASPGQRAVQRA